MSPLWSLAWRLLACGSAETSQPAPRPSHATEWDALVAAAERGDTDTLHVLARDFSLGDVADDHPSADRLGAALGFLQLADDPDDIAQAITRANAACAECHAARGVGSSK